MSILIVKLNAVGDVVRTTTLLRTRRDDVTWITDNPASELLKPIESVRCFSWSERDRALDRDYEIVVNLEDDQPVADFVRRVRHRRVFGAYSSGDGAVRYTEDARQWFDLSLISVYGREQADKLKLANRKTYQQLIFSGLDMDFKGEAYVLPPPAVTSLCGDVAIAPVAGPVWPMKAWAYYGQLQQELQNAGFSVNVLPRRESLLEHLGDVANHRCLVSGDSLPMHLALGTGTPCVTLFNCTSPWEIYDYGIQTKLVSPLLEQFFYKRVFDPAATTAIRLQDVFDAVRERLRASDAISVDVTTT